ncbi:cyclase family protein [Hyalangium versicolor]|uniref:cyclase family protein n=1 Tax=Hyalangium versicolor TaxID=2861190 RepID=UPI001CCAFE05|nr:cyclase family protein [Hyalangium versicolor]
MKLLPPLVLAAIVFASSPSTAQEASTTTPPLTTSEGIRAWKVKNSNWQRWGPKDELGSANLISPAKRKQAARLVQDGVSVSLARTIETHQAEDVPSPLVHTMLASGEPADSQYSADSLSIGFHGWSHTHIDALCHIFDGGKTFNGYDQSRVNASGCSVLSVNALKNGLVTRGVLIDMAEFKGVPYLEPGTPIRAEDLDAWEKKTKVQVSSGDAVIIRTGRWARRAAVGPWDVSKHSAGLHASTAEWFHKRGVSLVATDVGADMLPSGIEGNPMPVHVLLINTLGIYIIDNVDPEALKKAAAERHRYDFLLTVAPLAVEGGTGSPVNPIALF